MSNTTSESSITIKGQVTIPKEMRSHLHLAAGDRVKFFLDGRKRLYLVPAADIRQLRGIVKHPAGERLSIDELNEAAAEGWTSRPRRIAKQK